MELARNYIQTVNYPLEMDAIEQKLREFDLGFDEEFGLMSLAIQLNISSIKEGINLDNIKKSALELADRISDSELKNKGIPEIPQKFLDQFKQILERKLNIYFDTEQVLDFKIELEKVFYSTFAKNLICRSLYHVSLINNNLQECIELSKRNLISELEDKIGHQEQDFLIINCNGIEIQGIQKLFHYFEHYSQKCILKNSIETYKEFILIKIQSLLNSSHLDSEEKGLVNCAFNIIKYFISNQDIIDQYSTFIIINLDFEPDYLPQPIIWNNIPIRSRLSIYTYIYLIISEELPYIRNLMVDYSFVPSLSNKYHPSSREILRKISLDYPLIALSDKNIYTKSPFNWFKLIESISFAEFAFIPRLKIYNLDIASVLNEKLSHSISTIPEFIKQKRNISLQKLNDNLSSHVTICVSGFLSQQDDHQDQWKTLTELYPNTTFYSLTWDSSSTFQLILNTIRFNSVNKQFNECYEEAQVAGSYLAELLMTDGVMMKSCVSLIGFSLGTMVLFQCLDSLSHSNQKLIHDVVFLGSAVPEGLKYKIPFIRENSVSGKMLNIISAHDSILNNLFPIAGKEGAFGTSIIPGMETIDVSDTVKGHSLYRENLKKIFKKLENF